MKNLYLSVPKILFPAQIRLMLAGMAAAFVMAILPGKLLAQVPAFSYSSPQLYAVGVPISALSPSSTGGAVAALGFNTTVTPITAAGVGGALSMEMDKSGNIYIGEDGGNIMLLPAGSSTATVFATGFGPVYSVALDALNNVYAADNTHVWKIPAGGGTPVSLGSFSSPVGLAFNAAGSLFVACNDGSGIFTINTDGTGQAMYLFALPAPAYLAFDTNGNLLIGDQHIGGLYEPPSGGSQPIELAVGLGTIVSVKTDLSGKVYISNTSGIYCYSPGSGAVNIASVPSYGLMTDASFNLYYTAGGQLYKISPSGGYFTSPQLPRGLVIDPNTGAISGTPAAPLSSADYTVTAYNAAGSGTATVNIGTGLSPSFSYTTPAIYTVGTPISPLAPSSSSGVDAWGYSGSTTAIGSGYGIPTDVAADAAGNIYLSDYSHNQVVKLPAGGGAAVVLATGLSSPFGITIDAAGNLYFADAGNNAVHEIPAGTSTVNTIGSGFNGPTAVAVDATGNVYVADAGNNALKEIPAGNGTPVTIQSGFATLEGVAVDGAGNMYAADAGVGNTGNGAVYKIPAGGGSMVAIGTGFARPSGIAVDAAGNLYVTDINKSAITIIQPDGTQFTVGSGLNHPNGVCVDAGGNLYIADSGTGKIKEIKITGGYFLSPFLPAGLTFNNSSGLISGTLTVASDANYTVTAHNSYGATAKTVNIGANTAPAISYATPQTFTAGTAITPLIPANTGGTEYAPAFNNYPTTLSIGITDAVSTAMDKNGNLYIGESSGKVSVLMAGSTAATVFATGFSTQMSSGSIAIDTSGNVYVADQVFLWKIPAGGGTPVKIDSHNPGAVTVGADNTIYAGSMVSAIYTIASDGSNRTVIFNGGANKMAVDQNGNVFYTFRGTGAGLHEVPAGGTSKVIIPSTTFSAFTTDPSGNVYMINPDLSIGMVPAGSSTESQVLPTITGTTSIMIGPGLTLYTIVNGGIMKTNISGGYFISPELPAGLTINPSTGIISGTPAAVAPTTIYTVSAFNPVGSSTAPLNITVNSPTPIISYATPQTYTVGLAITPLTPSSTGGAVGAFGFNTTATTVNTGVSDAVSLAMDKSGNLYIGEGSGNISVLPAGASTATVFATGFSGAWSIALDASDNVFLADGAHVWKIPAGGGTAVSMGSFHSPVGLAFDAAGNIYVADNAGATGGVFKMNSDGTGQTRIDNNLPQPAYLAFDNNGNLFIGDQTAGALYEIPAGGVQKQVASGLGIIVSVVTDPSGNVYTSGRFGGIYCYSPGSGVTHINSTFTNGLMTDANFNLYYAYGNIYKISPSGGYFTNPQLPAGLTIDPTSGAISGTPAVASPTTNYTVTAYNSSGSGSAAVNIKVISADATLSTLTTSSGNINPAFSSGITSYAKWVSNAITTVQVTPTANDANATIKVNGDVVTSGTASGDIPLSVGPNVIPVEVTAQDGVTTKTYNLTINRRLPSNNALLAGLTLSQGSLSPVFAPGTNNYTASVSNATASVQVTPATDNVNAAVTVQRAVVAPGTASADIPLAVGDNTIHITVKAVNGTTRVYTIIVTRQSANALLANLTISNGTLTPAFVPGTNNYRDTVDNAVSSVQLTPTAANIHAGIKVNGAAVTTGTASGDIPLLPGDNNIRVVVTAGDGAPVRVYTVTVTRLSSNANLVNLTVSSGTLTPVFEAGKTSYKADVDNAVASIQLTPVTANAHAAVTIMGTGVISGTASGDIPLSVGKNVILTVVTAQDGTAKTYTVTVTRAGAPGSATTQGYTALPPANSPGNDGIVVHQGVSANGDGMNDALVIEGITNYPDNKLTIMNRSGILVYETKGYDNTSRKFDGHSNKTGKLQQPGTYFYSLDYKAGGETKHKTGFILLKW